LAVLSISGAVEKPMSWSLADLKVTGIVKPDLNHRKKGMVSYGRHEACTCSGELRASS
jgi:hypothetical protein